MKKSSSLSDLASGVEARSKGGATKSSSFDGKSSAMFTTEDPEKKAVDKQSNKKLTTSMMGGVIATQNKETGQEDMTAVSGTNFMTSSSMGGSGK